MFCVVLSYRRFLCKSGRGIGKKQISTCRLEGRFPQLGCRRWVCNKWGCISEGNKEHPKTQNTRKRRYLTVPRIRVFGCVSPLTGRQNTPENETHPKTQILRTVWYFFGCVLAPARKGCLVSCLGDQPFLCCCCTLPEGPKSTWEIQKPHTKKAFLPQTCDPDGLLENRFRAFGPK